MCSELNKRDVELFRGKRIIQSLTSLTLGPFVVFVTFVMVAKTEDHIFKSDVWIFCQFFFFKVFTSAKDKCILTYKYIHINIYWSFLVFSMKFGAQISSLYTLSPAFSKWNFKNMLCISVDNHRLYKILSNSLRKGKRISGAVYKRSN